jgi:DNA-binding GntR family transcriptional regulator
MADETLAEHIAQELRRNILRGKLLPGAPIKERDNAAEMGVSRTPMREAIRMLAKEGLVQLRPSRSPVVSQMTLKEAMDSIEVLTTLEMLSVKRACEYATPEDIANIYKVDQALAVEYDDLDQIERFERDMDFHIAIVQAAHNEALVRTHMAYLGRLWHARFQSARSRRTKERVLRQHAALAKAIEDRNLPLAQSELSAHLDHLVINVRAYFEALEAENDPVQTSSAAE